MRIRILIPFLAVAVIAAPLAFADDPCPTPAPGPPTAPPLAGGDLQPPAASGGQIVTIGASRFEVLQNPGSASITVRALAEPGRVVAVSQPPNLVVWSNGARREIALVAVSGQSNVWTATDDAFRSDAFEGRLRVSLNGEMREGSFRSRAAVGRADLDRPASPTPDDRPAAPAEPAGLERPLAAHGGRILTLCAARFEVVHDADAGTLRLFAIRDPAKSLALDADPTLVLRTKDGDRDLALKAVSGQNGAWEVTDDALKGANLDGTVRLTMGGQPCEANLSGLAPPMGARAGGVFLSFAGRQRLHVVHDASAGTLTFHAVEAAGPLTDAPKLSLRTPAGPRELTLSPVTGQTGTWSVTDAELKNASIDGTVSITVDGKPVDAPLTIAAAGDIVPPAPDAAPDAGKAPAKAPSAWESGMTGQTLVFGDGAARMQLHHDASAGRLGFLLLDADKPVNLDADPVLVLSTDDGDREIPLRRDPNKANAWIATDDRFKATSGVIKGKVKAKIGGQDREADFLHAMEEGDAQQPGREPEKGGTEGGGYR